MRTISLLLGRQLAADVVAQELGAFAHGGERRLELVRDVAQEARLLLLELGQARAQPFEPLAEVAQVLRPVDLDRVREVGAAHLPDREVELADRARDQHREQDRERDARCRRWRARAYSHFSRPCVAVSCRRSIARCVSWLRRGEHRLRAVDELRVAVGELASLRSGDRSRQRQQLVQPALADRRAASSVASCDRARAAAARAAAWSAGTPRACGRSRRAARCRRESYAGARCARASSPARTAAGSCALPARPAAPPARPCDARRSSDRISSASA